MKHKNIQKTVQEVLPINRKAKDTFFKTVYALEEHLRKLAAVLLGVPIDTATTANIRPVLFGNKENDLAFTCNDIFYVMVENQATVSPNIPYRLLEYITAALCSTVDSEQLLYGKKGESIFRFPSCICYRLAWKCQGKACRYRCSMIFV